MPEVDISNGQDFDILGAIASGNADFVRVHDQTSPCYPLDIQLGPNGGFIQLTDVGRFAKIDLRLSISLDQRGTDNVTMQVQRNLAFDPNPVPLSSSITAKASDNPDMLYSVPLLTWALGASDSYHTVGFRVVLLNRSGGRLTIPAGSRLSVWVPVELRQH